MARTNRKSETFSNDDQKYFDILARISDGLLISDEEGGVVEWNRDLENLTGVSAKEVINRPVWDVLAGLEVQAGTEEQNLLLKELIRNTMEAARHASQVEVVVLNMKVHRGEIHPVEISFTPLETNTCSCLIGTLRDLNEQRQAGQQISLQNSMLEAAANGIAITNRQGEIVWVNPAFTLITGYSLEEVQGKTFRVLKSGQQDSGVYKTLWETITSGKVWRGELINRSKNGSLFVEEQTITPVLDENGQITHFIAIMHDITKRKKTEEALLESESRHREILDNIKLVAIMLNQDGRVIYTNKFFLELAGWDHDEVLGKDWFKTFLPQEIRDEVSNLFFSKKIDPHYENEILTRSGDRRLIAWNNTFETDAEGKIKTITSIGEDITERRRAEMEVARLAAVVEQVAEGVVITDREKHILYANPFFETLTGFERDELLGQNYQTLQEGEPTSGFVEDIWQTVDQGLPWQGTLLSTRKDGNLFHEETTIFPIKDAKGKVINYAAIGRDITGRVEAEEQIQLQLRRLAALRTIDLAISSSLDLRVVLNVLLDQIVTQLNVDAATLLLLNPHTQMLEFGGGRGFRRTAIEQSYLRLGQGLAGRVASERRPINVPNFNQSNDRYTRAPLIEGENFTAYHAVPLIAKGQVKGVLEVYNRSPHTPQPEWYNFMETLAGQAAIAIDNATLLADLQRSNEELAQAYITTLEGWVKTLGLRDDETEDHTQRVTAMTLQLATTLGILDSELVHIRRGALLHDIGKMAVPDHILLKQGPLDHEEWQVMKRHPVDAFELLSPINYLRPALDIPYCHHERWDGSGYPRGLQGEEIPVAARIFAVADVWDALRSDRPYRRAWSPKKAAEYLVRQSGKHFDPRVLEAFFSTFNSETSKNGGNSRH